MRDDARLLEKKKAAGRPPGGRRRDTGAGGTLDGYDPGTDAADHPVEDFRGTYMGRDGGEAGAEGDRGQCTKRI